MATTGEGAEPKQELQPIPTLPKKYFGVLGNLPDFDPSFQLKTIWQFAKLYGDIFEVDYVTRKAVVISSAELMREIDDDERFDKVVVGATENVRDMIGDGLFTAHTWEKNWHKAHAILVPVFGPLAVRKMFDKQLDIASQLILRWDRLGPENDIVTADDFTRLAFDTIGFCSFNYRFNEFYSEHVHPFAQWMSDSLIEAGRRSLQPSLVTNLRYFSQQKYWNDIKSMQKLCDDIIEERTRHPQPEIDDLLNTMLNVADPNSGEKLDKDNIRNQMATFLVAGHETTSGTLSFMFLNLLKNPETYHKAQKEVDEVVGNDAITVKHIPQLKYLDACVKETLRFMGPIQLNQRHAKRDTVLGGKYPISPDVTILINLGGIHHDPRVWGEDHDEFKPERMLEFGKIPKGAWHPFGTGMRSCIGRAFAEQEMLLVTALILQRFQVEMCDPGYVMKLKSTLTIKPDNFKIRVRRRPGKPDMVGLQNQGKEEAQQNKAKDDSNTAGKPPLTVLYGSNAGTCKSYAEEVAAASSKFKVSINTLDSATEHIPKDQPVIIIAPSYEGKPADNAKKFVSWLESQKDSPKALEGVKYTVFGVGNSEWAATFHKIPKLIDELLSKMGASRFVDSGFVDVKTDPIGPWEDFLTKVWPALGEQESSGGESSEGIQVKLSKSEGPATIGGQGMSHGIVKENVELADASVGPAKKHIEIELPEDTEYRSGDYLAILPYNNLDTVKRVLRRFNIHPDDLVHISSTNKAFLKTSGPMAVYELLASRVELALPVTQRQIEKLAGLTASAPEQQKSLNRLAEEEVFRNEVLPKRASILDILEDHPACELTFAGYLDLLKGMALRQYSISSSPLSHRNLSNAVASSSSSSKDHLTATLTYDVHSAPEFWNGERSFHGVASSFLASCQPGTKIHCAVRSTNNAAFHLPKDPATPVIMICAGTGIAPMRGFIEERAAMLQAGGHQKLGPALLYFGCRDHEKDYIYRRELEHWEELGAVSLRPCFSKRGPAGGDDKLLQQQHQQTYKYVPDRMWAERDEVADLFKAGGKIYVCGSASKLAKSTADVCKKIYKERTGADEKQADEWLEKVKEDRYVSDVFG